MVTVLIFYSGQFILRWSWSWYLWSSFYSWFVLLLFQLSRMKYCVGCECACESAGRESEWTLGVILLNEEKYLFSSSKIWCLVFMISLFRFSLTWPLFWRGLLFIYLFFNFYVPFKIIVKLFKFLYVILFFIL